MRVALARLKRGVASPWIGGQVIWQASSLLVTLLLSATMAPREFGAYATVQFLALSAVNVALLTLMPIATTQARAEQAGQGKNDQPVVGGLSMVALALASCTVVCAAAGASWWSQFVFGDWDHRQEAILAGFWIGLLILWSYWQGMYLGTGRQLRYMGAVAVSTVVCWLLMLSVGRSGARWAIGAQCGFLLSANIVAGVHFRSALRRMREAGWRELRRAMQGAIGVVGPTTVSHLMLQFANAYCLAMAARQSADLARMGDYLVANLFRQAAMFLPIQQLRLALPEEVGKSQEGGPRGELKRMRDVVASYCAGGVVIIALGLVVPLPGGLGGSVFGGLTGLVLIAGLIEVCVNSLSVALYAKQDAFRLSAIAIVWAVTLMCAMGLLPMENSVERLAVSNIAAWVVAAVVAAVPMRTTRAGQLTAAHEKGVGW